MKKYRNEKQYVGTLPLLALIGGLASAPGTAPAIAGDSDTGRGEAPQWEIVTVDSLFRMNDDTLFRLSRQRNTWIEGPLSRFATHRILRAVQFAPDETRQLLHRYKKLKSDAKRLELVKSEMSAVRQRNGLSGDSQKFSSENPSEAAYYQLLDGMHLVLDLEEGLREIREREDPEEQRKHYRRLMGIF